MANRAALLIGAGIATMGALGMMFVGCTPTTAGTTEAPAATEEGAIGEADTLDATYLGLSVGALRAAVLTDLPDDLLLRADEVSLTRGQLGAEIERRAAAGGANEQVRDYPFFLLENLAIEALLAAEAREWAVENGRDPESGALIDDYIQSIADAVTVEETEVRAFFDANPSMFGGATYEEVHAQLRPCVLNMKRQDAVTEHIDALSERVRVEVDADFVAQAAKTELDNAVDRARRAGLPALVDFGSEGCGPCDMMTPILAELETELAGKCTVLFVPVREEPILAARYGIRSIPVQVFFDADGREVFRHVGFLPKEEIMAQLQEIGVQ